MAEPTISTQIRIQTDPGFSCTVENSHIDFGYEGLTISAWFEDERREHVFIDKGLAIAVADAIYKLFKEENN